MMNLILPSVSAGGFRAAASTIVCGAGFVAKDSQNIGYNNTPFSVAAGSISGGTAFRGAVISGIFSLRFDSALSANRFYVVLNGNRPSNFFYRVTTALGTFYSASANSVIYSEASNVTNFEWLTPFISYTNGQVDNTLILG